jgi:non-ribosomal peptide synthase protein (TIGR01720 family)
MFQHQTIADLAAVAGTVRVHAEQGLVTGPVPLSPAQHQFLEMDDPNPQYHSIGILLEARERLEPGLVEEAVRHLLRHHDALRLRLRRAGTEWELFNANLDEVLPFTRFDWSDLSEMAREQAPDAAFDELQNRCDLAVGPLFQVAHLEHGPGQPTDLVLDGHYLALDIMSWHILLEDLETACQQLLRGEPVKLPPKTTAFKHWTERLAAHAGSAALRAELAYWLAESRRQPPNLPLDYPDGYNTVGSIRAVTVFLDAAERRALQEIAKSFDAHIDDVLLTALMWTLAQWTGQRAQVIYRIGHGREAIFEDVDLSRTVGWLNTAFPLLLDLEDAASPGDAVQSIKKQLRQLPNGGIGYGLLRYLCRDDEVVRQMKELPPPGVAFNYVGEGLPRISLFGVQRVFSGPGHDPESLRPQILQVSAGFSAGGELRMNWDYSANLHRQSTIEALARSLTDTLRAFIVAGRTRR